MYRGDMLHRLIGAYFTRNAELGDGGDGGGGVGGGLIGT